MEQYPDLTKTKTVFGKIFDSENLFEKESFDLIIIPMNTFPAFSYENVKKLFPILYSLLQPGGKLLFSARPERVNEKYSLTMNENDYNADWKVEKNNYSIASITYTFPGKKTSYGFRNVYYRTYNVFDKYLNLLSRTIIRNEQDFITHEKLHDVFNKYAFSILTSKVEKFSHIYILQK